jgi:two-component system, chemotaxis family, CheB/CheR fusion protein
MNNRRRPRPRSKSNPSGAAAATRSLGVDQQTAQPELLAIRGFELAIARDGSSTVEMPRAFEPGVILLDIGLPGVDGYEVARRLLSMIGERKPLLVATSGYGQGRDRERSRLAGFDYHLVKPISHAELLGMLSTN